MLYEGIDRFSQKEKSSLKASFAAGMQQVRVRYNGMDVNTAFRSAGPLCLDMSGLGAAHFRHFWTTGVTFQAPNQAAPPTLLNPTFAFSTVGREFSVHYGSDPLLAFHLADALAEKKANLKSISLTDLVESAQSQFDNWLSSFRQRVAKPCDIVIRFFAGDALAFSRTLQPYSTTCSTGIYTHSWGGVQIKLDETEYGKFRAPRSFNVIDTSNLADHLGLLNILIASIPLLSKHSSAVLHTSTFQSSTGEGKFIERTCADIPTLSLLLGVVPTPYVSGFTTRSNAHEIIGLALMGNRVLHEAISWKALPSMKTAALDLQPNTHPKFHPKQLGAFLFSIYLNMFSDEDMSKLMDRANELAYRFGAIHYVRSSFVALLKVIKHSVSTDWPQAIAYLLSLIEADRTLLTGSNYYLDLCCHMYLQDVYSVSSMRPSRPIGTVFQGMDYAPPVICVVLRVPRSALKVLESTDLNGIGTPLLQCEVMGPRYHNAFPSIQCTFGAVTRSSDGKALSIEEDRNQWAGSSPLIVSFYMPSWMLTLGPSTTTISFNVRSTFGTSHVLIPKLGLMLAIFSARLTDDQHVFITKERPGNFGELKSLASASSITNRTSDNAGLDTYDLSVGMNVRHMKASVFTGRINIVSAFSRTAFSSGATVTVRQSSPTTMLVSFKDLDYSLAFPYIIDGHAAKVRVSRKSHYIEVCLFHLFLNYLF
jgi:hypothetical protein